jgi:hypothetical protein
VSSPSSSARVAMPRGFSTSGVGRRVLLLAGLCAVAAIPWLTSAQSSNAEPKYKLSGTVNNSVTGEPIGRALVQIYAGSQPVALSDGNGQFEFEGLAAGNISIDVHKPGFFNDQQSSQPSAPQVVNIGPEAKPVLLRLTPESVIYGRAQSADGEPIEHLPVKVVAVHVVEGKRRWDVVGSVATDDEGEFRIANLTSGSYYVEAGPSWRFLGAISSQQHPEGYPGVFYGGAADLNSATPIQLGAGQQLRTDFVLQTAPLFKVSGVISGFTQDQDVNIHFEDRLGDAFTLFSKFDPTTGQFQTAAPAGLHRLKATAWGQNGTSLNAEMPLNISSDLSGVRLMLTPAHVIPVIVRTEATRPMSATVRHNRAVGMPLPNVHLRTLSNIEPSEFWARPEGTNNRALALPDVPSGKYSLDVDTNGPWYVESAQCGDADLLREDLVATVGVQTPPIEIVLRDDGATLNGKVSAGQSPRPAVVVLLPEHGSGSRRKTAFASLDGNFTIQNLAPGDYSVFAFDHSDELEYANPDVLQRYVAGAVHISLQPNEEHTVNLDVIHVGN